MIRSSLMALMFVVAFPVVANPMSADKGDFGNQQAAIVRALDDGKTYSEISLQDKRQVRDSLERMSALIEGSGSVAQLAADQKVELFNEQERVNTILTKASADSRLICERATPVGTRMKSNNCQTVAERRRRREVDQQSLQSSQGSVLPIRE